MNSTRATHPRDLPLETQLSEALAQIESFQQCALLDYPDHLNSGDHLIWLGTCIYLVETRRARITYASSLVDFDQKEMREKNGNSAIFLQGGGNLGDLWPDSQKFREKVISQNHDCPIYILPQAIFFSDESARQKACEIFNAHPNLTIFARDQVSFEFSEKHFSNARTILAPDMVFCLAPVVHEFFKRNKTAKVKFICRTDKESTGFQISTYTQKEPGICVEDWETYKWLYDGRGKIAELPEIFKRLPGSVFVVRELWQRGIKKPRRQIDRIRWRYLKRFEPILAAVPNREQTLFSWMVAFDALKQISECSLLVTDRLHVHLTACILGVRNGLLANSYHKNEVFFTTWNMQNKNSRFLSGDAEIDAFLKEK